MTAPEDAAWSRAGARGQDGDLLLLAADGRVHAFTHDDWEDDGVVAESFDALLRALAATPRRSKAAR